jgi:hypothetical protein
MKTAITIFIMTATIAWGQFAPVLINTNSGLYQGATGGAVRIPSVTVSNLNVQGALLTTSGLTWDDLRVNPEGLNPVGLADAASLVIDSGASGDQIALRFVDSGTKVAATTFQMPHSWAYEMNTNVYPHIHFLPNATATGAVVFAIKYAYSDIGDVHPSSASVTNIFHITTNSQWKHILWNLPTNGITMNGLQYSAILDWRIERLGNNGEDTYAGDIDVKSADLHYLDRGSPIDYTP